MISPADFYEALRINGLAFFTGVPDSLLKELCAFITDNVPSGSHVINANEGSAVALAVGYHMATGRTPVVYLQNSGTGNIINPLLSLADPAVYRVPILFLVGWRGEPGVPDEPQHVTQGRLMFPLLEAIEVGWDVVDAETRDVETIIRRALERMTSTGKSHVFLIRRNTFSAYGSQREVGMGFPLTREQALGGILASLQPRDVIVSTTGMTSREVFEYRERRGEGHHRDFLTVGSMGHCSQIALGLAQHVRDRRVLCLDGDGAVIMHMGSLAIIGAQRPENLLHVVINNGAHDSVGGQPTVGRVIDIPRIALACGYRHARSAETLEEVESAVHRLRDEKGPVMLEIRVKKGARKDLGRPTTTPLKNKLDFMEALRNA